MVASVGTPALPKGPYPGLRPFYDNESTFFFGRTRHSEEIVDRLKRKSRFVAIIGGSGSGKSSLVRAGVIPRLRTYGIPDAGDLWIPLVMTPGTNPSSLSQSPVSRLARRFSTILKPLPSLEESDNRVSEIAAVFRQQAGFERLLDRFVSELVVPPGASPKNARILFVIDQFEEIFHITNASIADVHVFVDRIVDHFFNPHPSCFILLTMRSEYLNYCPSYLELPDTINSSLYLVPRLDRDEICEAIVDPPRIFNRYVRRQNPEMTTIPIAPQFSTEVLDRILADTDELTDDPDHLPLLQHLLARLWQVSCDRRDTGNGAIDSITWEDLETAVSPGGIDCKSINREGVVSRNILRSCLENWANTAYSSFEASERDQIDQILRQLAFKDPNTGTYTQQRLPLNASTLLLPGNKSAPDLRHRLELNFIDKVSYLSWDNENPATPSLKVSHESFIRGWSHFRNLIDVEANRFEEFLTVLRKCLSWSASGERDELLLGSSDLVRIQIANLQKVLSNEKDGEDWFKVLEHYRDGKQLAEAKPHVEKFYRDSRNNEDQRKDDIKKLEALERQKIARNRTIFAGAAAVVCLCLALGFILPEWLLFTNELVPATSEVLLKKSRAVRDARRTLGSADPKTLETVVRASYDVLFANEKQAQILSNLGKRVYFQFPGIRDLLLDRRIRVLNEVLAGSWNDEPEINYITRSTLSSHIWQTTKPKNDQDEIPTPVRGPQEGVKCQSPPSSDKRGEDFIPERHFVQRTNASGSGRSLLVTKNLETRRNETVLLGSYLDSSAGNCIAQTILFAIPNKLSPRILFDSSMQYLFVVTTDKVTQIEVLTIYSLDWDWKQKGLGRAWKDRTVIQDKSIVGNFSQGKSWDAVSVLPGRTWVHKDGIVIESGATYWKIILQEAARQSSAAALWAKLNLANEESVCAKLKQGASSSQESGPLLYEDNGHCILISRVSPPGQPPSPSSAAVPRQDRPQLLVVVDVYSKMSMNSKGPAQEASIPLSRIEFGSPPKEATKWFMGMPKTDFDGWIALEISATDKGKGDYLVAPWSTDSLRRVACSIIGLAPRSQGLNEAKDQREASCSDVEVRL